MKVFVCVCVLVSLAVCGNAIPSKPQLSSTCSFNYVAKSIGGFAPQKVVVKGVYAAIYDEDETKRMQMVNQSTTVQGTKTRHDWTLDIMETGIEYYMNWTRGMPQYCSQSQDAYVEGLWEELEEYHYKNTTTFNGMQVDFWRFNISDTERLELGVKSDDVNTPVIFQEVVEVRGGKEMTNMYMINNYSSTPKQSMFTIPKLCQVRSRVMATKKLRRRSTKLPFSLFR